jgi:hypothetical protein
MCTSVVAPPSRVRSSVAMSHVQPIRSVARPDRTSRPARHPMPWAGYGIQSDCAGCREWRDPDGPSVRAGCQTARTGSARAGPRRRELREAGPGRADSDPTGPGDACSAGDVTAETTSATSAIRPGHRAGGPGAPTPTRTGRSRPSPHGPPVDRLPDAGCCCGAAVRGCAVLLGCCLCCAVLLLLGCCWAAGSLLPCADAPDRQADRDRQGPVADPPLRAWPRVSPAARARPSESASRPGPPGSPAASPGRHAALPRASESGGPGPVRPAVQAEPGPGIPWSAVGDPARPVGCAMPRVAPWRTACLGAASQAPCRRPPYAPPDVARRWRVGRQRRLCKARAVRHGGQFAMEVRG